MRLAVVEVQVERAGGVQNAPQLLQPWRQEAEVVVELIAIGRLREQLGRVAAPAEAGAVTAVTGAPVVSLRRVWVRPVLNGGSAYTICAISSGNSRRWARLSPSRISDATRQCGGGAERDVDRAGEPPAGRKPRAWPRRRRPARSRSPSRSRACRGSRPARASASAGPRGRVDELRQEGEEEQRDLRVEQLDDDRLPVCAASETGLAAPSSGASSRLSSARSPR